MKQKTNSIGQRRIKVATKKHCAQCGKQMPRNPKKNPLCGRCRQSNTMRKTTKERYAQLRKVSAQQSMKIIEKASNTVNRRKKQNQKMRRVP